MWVEKIDTRIVKDSYFQPQKGDCVLNFNYTTTIEDNFDTSDIEIIHIHGIINQDIVLKRQNNDFIVCNHDLLIANLKKINGYGTPLLADAPIIVIDEAHNLEDSARSQLTMQCCDFVEFFFVLFGYSNANVRHSFHAPFFRSIGYEESKGRIVQRCPTKHIYRQRKSLK